MIEPALNFLMFRKGAGAPTESLVNKPGSLTSRYSATPKLVRFLFIPALPYGVADL